MQNLPLNRNKLIIPEAPNYFVQTKRINKICTQIADKKIVSIVAPSGYGKTTLAAAAVNLYQAQSIKLWYRLELEDQDPYVFFSYFIEMLFPVEDNASNAIRTVLECCDFGTQHRYVCAVICEELYRRANRRSNGRTFIVLDDFQNVADSEEIVGAVSYVAQNMPAGCEMILISRVQLSIVNPKQKLLDNFLELESGDLRFSQDEACELMGMICKKNPVSPELTDALHSAEGWAAGIVMICQAFEKSMPGRALDVYGADDKLALFHYMTLEVLKAIDPHLKRFLSTSTLLNDFTVDEAEKILGFSDASELIDKCEAQNLFIQKSVGKDTVYRFHRLFGDVLGRVRSENLSSEEIKEIHGRAAEYFLGKKSFNAAIKHSLLTGDINQTAEIVALGSADLISLGSMEQLKILFDLIPENLLQTNPALIFMKSYIYQNGEEALILLEKALSMFEKTGDVKMQIRVLFSIVAYHLFRNSTGRALEALAKSRTAASRMEGGEKIARVVEITESVWREDSSVCLGMKNQADFGQIDAEWLWSARMYCSIGNIIFGRPQKAAAFMRQALGMSLVEGAEMLKGFSLLFLAVASYLNGEPEVMKECNENLRRIGERYGVLYMISFSRCISAMELGRNFQNKAAVLMLEEGCQCFEQLGNKNLQALFTLYKYLMQADDSDLEVLLEKAKQEYENMLQYEPGFLLHELGEVFLGAIALEAGDFTFSEKCLQHVLQRCTEKKALQIKCSAQLLLSDLYHTISKHQKGTALLKAAIHEALLCEYMVFPGVPARTIVRTAYRAASNDIYKGYVRKIVSCYFHEEAAAFLEEKAMEPLEDIHGFSRQFLSLFAAHSETVTGRIKVSLFGSFRIEIDGNLIPKNEFKTKKAESLVKYLLLNKDKVISRDFLTELFWPDSDEKAGATSMRSALYTIRKVLGHYGIPSRGKEALFYESGGCIKINSAVISEIDTDHFYEKLRAAEKNREESVAASQCSAGKNECIIQGESFRRRSV